MSADLLSFPSRPAFAGSDAIARPARFGGSCLTALRRYRLADLVAVLALEALVRRSQIDRLRQLARIDGLPLPLNPRIWAGQRCRGAEAICAASEWDAAEVDAWLHRPGFPPPAAQGTVPDLPLDLHAAMRSRAVVLAAGGRR